MSTPLRQTRLPCRSERNRNEPYRRSRSLLPGAPCHGILCAMCNLYNVTTSQQAIIDFVRATRDLTGNLEPSIDVYPDRMAPIVRNATNGARELARVRWGLPSSSQALFMATKKRAEKLEAKEKPVDFPELLKMEPDSGTTNVRNTASKHWTRWLGVENRCVVPVTSFAEPAGSSQPRRQGPAQRLVRARRRSTVDVLRGRVGARMDQRAQDQDRRRDARSIRLPDDRAEHASSVGASEGDADHSHHSSRGRDVAFRPVAGR